MSTDTKVNDLRELAHRTSYQFDTHHVKWEPVNSTMLNMSRALRNFEVFRTHAPTKRSVFDAYLYFEAEFMDDCGVRDDCWDPNA